MDIGEVVERKMAKDRLNDLYIMEETKWRQRAKVRKVKEGGMNTKYFHMVATARRRRMSLKKIMINRVLEDDQEVIGAHIEQFYLKPTECWRMTTNLSQTQQSMQSIRNWMNY